MTVGTKKTDERTDIGYRLAGWLCKWFGHQWQVWRTIGPRRCKRCLRWEE
jgi:hypothetical protein